MIGFALVAADPVSAPVTQWPARIALVLIMVGIIALVLLGMRRGWVRRARSQREIPPPDLPNRDQAAPTEMAITGVYLGTTTHGDWLDRVVVHDLGVRSRMLVQVGPEGIAVWREGARDLLIPSSSLRAAGMGRGIAGKAYERDGVLIVTWELGGRLMDTGLRADTAEDQRALLEAVLAIDEGEVRR